MTICENCGGEYQGDDRYHHIENYECPTCEENEMTNEITLTLDSREAQILADALTKARAACITCRNENRKEGWDSLAEVDEHRLAEIDRIKNRVFHARLDAGFIS